MCVRVCGQWVNTKCECPCNDSHRHRFVLYTHTHAKIDFILYGYSFLRYRENFADFAVWNHDGVLKTTFRRENTFVSTFSVTEWFLKSSSFPIYQSTKKQILFISEIYILKHSVTISQLYRRRSYINKGSQDFLIFNRKCREKICIILYVPNFQ